MNRRSRTAMGGVSEMLLQWQGRGSARKSVLYETPIVLLVIAVVWVPVVVHGVEFVVGGNSNWTNPIKNNLSRTFYEDWKAGKTFHVEDILRFRYKPAHTVLEVNKDAFNNCSLPNPKLLHNDGNTTVRLDRSGSWFFICGAAGHCSDGQKLSIDVQNASTTSRPTGPTPAPSGSFMRSMAASLGLATAMAASICIFLFAP